MHVIELARRAQDGITEVSARFWVGVSQLGAGEVKAAETHALAMLSSAERLHDRYWLTTALWLSERPHLYQGDWDAAREFNQRALLESPSDTRLFATRMLLESECGNEVEAQAFLERLLDSLRLLTPEPRYEFGTAASLIAVAARITGNGKYLNIAESAAATVLSAETATPRISDLARVGLGMIAVLRGDAPGAMEQHSNLGSIAGSYFVGLSGDRILGLLAHTMGDFKQAVSHFEDCVAVCREAGYRPELAWACHD